MRGVAEIDVPSHGDCRGRLFALDGDQSLPFDVRRVYCIFDSRPGAVRGEHATSADCAVVVLSGVADVDLDNGAETRTIRLSSPEVGLCIHAGVWLRLRLISEGAVVLVAASRRFAETSYFESPQPDLLRGMDDEWMK